MVLLWPVACVIGPSKLPSVLHAVCNAFQHTRLRHRCCRVDAKKAPAGEDPAGAFLVALCCTFYGIGDALGSVPVLVVGGDEVGITEDAMFVDVEAVEFLLGLDPYADRRLEKG